MATNFEIRKNGETLKVSEKTARVLAGIITTKNPDTVTAKNAVELAGGDAYVQQFAEAGESNDVFEIVENGKLTGKGIRENIARKMGIVLDVARWQTEIFTDKVEKSARDDGEMEVI